jgi:NAD(P)H-quinone oxidoreductase subunit 5
LLAHSLYKAHAFLGAGGTVRQAMLRQLTPPARAPGALTLAVGAAVGLGMTAIAGAAWTFLYPQQSASPTIWLLAGIVALALVPLVNGRAFQLGGAWLPALAAGAFAVAFAYFGLHLLFAQWVSPASAAPPATLLIAVALAFGLLFLLQCLITIAPHSPAVRRLYPWFYGGLFLDEKVTRLLFSIWPPPQPRGTAQPLPIVESTPNTGARS